MGISVVSLFDWKSWGQLALNELWIKVDKYFASEVDKHAMTVSKSHFPDTVYVWDVLWVSKSTFDCDIDLLIWWSPCQWFSRAWKGLNFNDPRSKLFFEFVRILHEVKPKYFLLENVVMKKEWQDIITENLWVDPQLVNSRLVTAQNRERLYWFWKLQDDGTYKKIAIDQPQDQWILLIDILEKDVDYKYIIDDTLYQKLVIDRSEKSLKIRNATNQWWIEGFPWDSVIIDFPESKTKRWRVKSWKAGTLTTSHNMWVIMDDLRIRKLTPVEYERLQGLPDWYTWSVTENQRIKICWNWWTNTVIKIFFQKIKDDILNFNF